MGSRHRRREGPAMALRIGGVPEHFSLPIQLCLESSALGGAAIEFVPQPAGTGQMIANLNAGELEVAVALTEGLVMAIENGSLQAKIHSVFVESPLEWGIHVSAKSDIRSMADLDAKTCRLAISRKMSGSHLMGYVLCAEYGWNPDDLQCHATGGLRGTLEAFQEDKVDLFLWDRFMTAPCCGE